jgi:arsenite oxidase small subunit
MTMADELKKSVHLPQWQEDFPIQWDDDHYVTRRELAKFLSLGSGLLACATVGLAVAASTRVLRAYEAKRICSASALTSGSSLLFRYPTDKDPCILVRTKLGELVAFSQVCTHLSCAVIYRKADDRLFCPCHNGVFECHAGSAGAEPLEGPPERPLPRIVLSVRDGDVFATGVVA